MLVLPISKLSGNCSRSSQLTRRQDYDRTCFHFEVDIAGTSVEKLCNGARTWHDMLDLHDTHAWHDTSQYYYDHNHCYYYFYHEVICSDMTLYARTWHDMRQPACPHDVTWHDVTGCDTARRVLPCNVASVHGMTCYAGLTCTLHPTILCNYMNGMTQFNSSRGASTFGDARFADSWRSPEIT